MTTKNRKKTIYFTIVINIILAFISSLIFEGGTNIIVECMCVLVLLFTFIGTTLPLFDRFWDVIANFFYLLAVSLPTIILIDGVINIIKPMSLNQPGTGADYFLSFSLVVYGCYGIAVVLLGKTHRMHPFWSKGRDGGKKNPGKNHLGLQKIQGFAGYKNQTNPLK